jgi:peptidoglycan glycosyltransferase
MYAPITGFYSLVYGATGLEQAEDPVLAGTSDSLFVKRLSDEISGHQPQGGSVVLTINPKAQQAAYAGLAASGHPGAAVALDPQTGAILALASYPSYNPSSITSHNGQKDTAAYKQLLAQGHSPLLNRALNQTYPPGSTFKVITTAAALSSGKYTPNSRINAASPLTFRDTTHSLSNSNGEECDGGGMITLTEALAVSCNTAYGRLGVALGTKPIAAQAKAFGFGKQVATPIVSAPSRYVTTSDAPLLADSAIGQFSDAVTPLQMAMVAATIANHGVTMAPYLVSQTRAPDTSVLSTTHAHALRTAVSPQVASQITSMMVDVVNNPAGTGYNAGRIPGVTVAGKTGTAENVSGQQPHAWFISFAPAASPKVAVAVIVEHGGFGGTAAAPIAKSITCAVLGCP